MGTIAILDSGVGGLSVYQEIVKKCPDHRYIFVSDNDAFPYGTKSEHVLIERVSAVVRRIVVEFAPDMLVLACNTASTIVLPTLRALYELPIIGVVPAIKPAAKLSKTKKIGLLATPGTIEREYTHNLINEFASDCEVTTVASSALVELAELKLYGNSIKSSGVENELLPILLDKEIDVLVLACTHFPLLSKEIEKVFLDYSRPVNLIDSGRAIANRVSNLIVNDNVKGGLSLAIFTRAADNSQYLMSYLNQVGLSENYIWEI